MVNYIKNIELPDGTLLEVDTEQCLKRNQITNCVLEIPQDIKLEKNGETITAKAGTVLYDALGNSITLSVDRSTTLTYTSEAECYLLIRKSNQGLFQVSTTDSRLTFTNDKVMHTTEGECWLPLGIVTRNIAGKSTLDQTFNGIGYIGSTIFLLPGLKTLMADGRNSDGTLNNYVHVTINCDTYSAAGTNPDAYLVIDQKAGVTSGGIALNSRYITNVPNTSLGNFTYNIPDNKIYSASEISTTNKRAFVAKVAIDNGTIISFTPIYPFRAVDYDDFYDSITRLQNNITTLDNNAVTLNETQTITGNKTFTQDINIQKNSNTYHSIICKNNNVDYTNLQTGQYGARFLSTDKNGQYFGLMQTDVTANNLRTYLGARRKVNGVDKQGNLELYVTSDGSTYATAPTYTNYADNSTKIVTTAYMANHWCTTAPTTASTASNARPAVVVENYRNGTSGYRVWSDGYCEQWGYVTNVVKQSPQTVNIIKNMINTNYIPLLTGTESNGGNDNGSMNALNKTTSSFQIFNSSDNAAGCYWKVEGYIK